MKPLSAKEIFGLFQRDQARRRRRQEKEQPKESAPCAETAHFAEPDDAEPCQDMPPVEDRQEEERMPCIAAQMINDSHKINTFGRNRVIGVIR